jgi:hypothetical protein
MGPDTQSLCPQRGQTAGASPELSVDRIARLSFEENMTGAWGSFCTTCP